VAYRPRLAIDSGFQNALTKRLRSTVRPPQYKILEHQTPSLSTS